MKMLLTTLNTKFIHTSLSVRYLYQSVKDLGRCDVMEFTINDNIENIFSSVYKNRYDIIGFSCYIWNIEKTLKVCSNLKKADPDVRIILGGPEVSFDSIALMKEYDFIDYIIEGEGESALRKLALYLRGNYEEKDQLEMIGDVDFKENTDRNIKESMDSIINIGDIDSLIYRSKIMPDYPSEYVPDSNGRFIIRNKKSKDLDLSQVRSPYLDSTRKDFENKIVYYETSRGCTFNCDYCLSSVTKGVRFFPLDMVRKDLKHLVDLGVKQIKFVDRTFNSHKEKTLEIIRYLIEIDDKKINFHFEITAHMLDEKMMDILKDARPGLFQFEIGVQSTNPKTIKAVNRVDNFEVLSEKVKTISSYKNIHQHLDLIAGLPYEDLVSFKKSFNDVFMLRPDMLQMGFLKMLKGSPIRENSEKYGYVYREYPPYEYISNDFISASETLYLKDIEDLVDSYYNSGLYRYSADYLYTNYYKENPFGLFEDLLSFKEKNIPDGAVSRDKAFQILYDFHNYISGSDDSFFAELLKLDYLLMGRNRVIPEFLKGNSKRPDQKKIIEICETADIQSFFDMNGIHPMQIIKNLHAEIFSYDILSYINEGRSHIEENIMLLFDYSGAKDYMEKVKFTGGKYEI